MGIDLSEIKGKTVTGVDLTYDETEINLTFSDGSSLSIRSEGGHEVMLSEVTADWVFDPLEIAYYTPSLTNVGKEQPIGVRALWVRGSNPRDGAYKKKGNKMKRLNVLLIICLLLCVSTLAYAQEISRLPIPSVYNVQMGRHVYYMPKSTLEFKGYDFSTKRTWSHDSYVSWKLPLVDLTYTHSPGGLSEADGAMLFSTSRRGDIELKLGQVVNPTFNLEWSAMDLHTWHIAQIEKTTTDKEGKEFTELVPVMVHNRDAIQRVYGGAGLAFETPILYALTFKAAGSYRFINQRGWEGSAGLCWTPGKAIKGEPHVFVGVTTHEAHYDWGVSRSLGFMAEFAMTF